MSIFAPCTSKRVRTRTLPEPEHIACLVIDNQPDSVAAAAAVEISPSQLWRVELLMKRMKGRWDKWEEVFSVRLPLQQQQQQHIFHIFASELKCSSSLAKCRPAAAAATPAVFRRSDVKIFQVLSFLFLFFLLIDTFLASLLLLLLIWCSVSLVCCVINLH